MRLYIAPLDFSATVDTIRDMFSSFGEVANVIIPPNHRRPWQSNRGHAFVDMPDPTAAQCAICLLYTSPSPRDLSTSRMPSSA